MSRSSQKAATTQMVVIGLAAAAAAVSVSLLVWHLSKRKQLQQQLVPEKSKKDGSDLPQSSTPLKKPNKSTNNNNTAGAGAGAVDTDPTPRRNNTTSVNAVSANMSVASVATEATTVKSTSTDDEKAIHLKIEEFDKKGKALFKSKKVRPRSAVD